MPKTPKTPFDKVRDAFAELDASEKTAFVLEATFAAVGEGLAETGRRFSGAVQDIDDLFTADHRRPHSDPAHDDATPHTDGGTAPGATAKPKAAKPDAKSTAKPKSKTAGKTTRKPSKPDTDDDA